MMQHKLNYVKYKAKVTMKLKTIVEGTDKDIREKYYDNPNSMKTLLVYYEDCTAVNTMVSVHEKRWSQSGLGKSASNFLFPMKKLLQGNCEQIPMSSDEM